MESDLSGRREDKGVSKINTGNEDWSEMEREGKEVGKWVGGGGESVRLC